MNPSPETHARDFLTQLYARIGIPDGVNEEDVAQLTNLLWQVVLEERQACVEIVEETVRLFGSATAEHAAHRIRARGDE